MPLRRHKLEDESSCQFREVKVKGLWVPYVRWVIGSTVNVTPQFRLVTKGCCEVRINGEIQSKPYEGAFYTV